MRYVEARINEFDRDEAYRIYVTRSLRLAPQNKYIIKDYKEIVNAQRQNDFRTGDDIAIEIFDKAGLKFR